MSAAIVKSFLTASLSVAFAGTSLDAADPDAHALCRSARPRH